MKRMSSFEIYLCTGRRVDEPVETKFNHWHNPEDGQFTFAGQGRYVGSGSQPASRLQSGRTRARVSAPITKRPAAGASAKPVPPVTRDVTNARVLAAVTPADLETRTTAARRPVISKRSLISTAPTLKSAAAKLTTDESKLVRVGDLRIVQFGPGVELVPVAVASVEEFSAATAQAQAMFRLEATITGPQFALLRGSYGLHGQAVVNGRILGNSAPEMYYMRTVIGFDGVYRLTFGKGDPPLTGAGVGFGGAVPLLINGQPVAGYDKAWKRYSKSSGTGKNIVAYNSKANAVALFIQPHGTNGYSLVDVRSYIAAAGYDHAVMFDGSGSASLRYRGKAVVNPDVSREPFIPLGIGFRMKGR